MVNQTKAPETKDIVTWLQGLDAGADHYDNYMMGLKALNPKFIELDQALEGTGGLKQEIEKSMRDPKFLDLLVNASQDNSQFEQILSLTNSAQGQKLLTLSLGAINGGIAAGSSALTSTEEQYSLLKDLGLIEKAKAAGLNIEDNPIKTPTDALMLLSTLIAPIGPIAPARAAFMATTKKAIPYFAPKAGKAAISTIKNPIKSSAALIAGDVITNDGDATKYVTGKGIDWAAEAIIGEKNYKNLKELYNEGMPEMPGLPDMPDVPEIIADNSGTLLATAGLAIAAYVAYNIGSSALSMAFNVGKYVLGAAAIGYAGNFVYQNLLSPSPPSA